MAQIHLNSKNDYYTLKKIYKPKKWLPYWKALNKNRERFFDIGEFPLDECYKDDTHYYEAFQSTDKDTGEPITIYHMYELRTDYMHPFFRYHFTQEEIDKSIEEGENLLAQGK